MVQGIGPALLRLPALTGLNTALKAALQPGQVVRAEVLSAGDNRAVLVLAGGLQVEAQIQAALAPGQKLRLQVQPRRGSDPEAPVIMKLLEILPEGEAARMQSPHLPPEASRTEQPAVFWLPVPLPDGSRGWVQVSIDPEAPRQAEQEGEEPDGPAPVTRLRLFWETPNLGAVQVAVEAAGRDLSARFTASLPDSRERLEEALPHLARQLAAVGFPDARLGSRAPLPGERVEPLAEGGPARLDERV